MFSRRIVTNITSASGTVHCRKTRIPCRDQLMIFGHYLSLHATHVVISLCVCSSLSVDGCQNVFLIIVYDSTSTQRVITINRILSHQAEISYTPLGDHTIFLHVEYPINKEDEEFT
jgi:hypothetical protein